MINVSPGDPITAELFNKVASGIPRFSTLSSDTGYITAPDGTVLINQWNKLMAAPSGNASLRPFALRWMPTSTTDTDVGEWQIYLPSGCATLNRNDVYFPANDSGKDKNGDYTFQWYKIKEPKDSDANVRTINGYVYKEWTVFVHFKDYPLMYASTIQNDDEDFPGSSQNLAVGTLLQKEWNSDGGKKMFQRKTIQSFSQGYNRDFENNGSFKIVFQTTGGSAKDPDSYKIWLTNQYIQFGVRNSAWIEENTDITSMEDVVLKIDHSTEDVTIEIIDEMRPNTMDETYVRILKLKDKGIVSDNRNDVRKTWEFYAN